MSRTIARAAHRAGALRAEPVPVSGKAAPRLSQELAEAMRQNGIERIIFVPATDLVPHDSIHVHLIDGWLAEHVGVGSTFEEALNDAQRRVYGREAA